MLRYRILKRLASKINELYTQVGSDMHFSQRIIDAMAGVERNLIAAANDDSRPELVGV